MQSRWSVVVVMVRFGVLGPLAVVRDGDPVLPRSAKQRLVLAVLLVHADQVVPLDRLVDALWRDRPPSTATGVLRTYVSQLRKALEPGSGDRPEVLVTAHPGYRLIVPAEDLDALRFERLLAEGRSALDAGRPSAAAAALRQGLALWRGPAYADVADEESIRDEARRLDELRVLAVEDRVEADLALGQHAALVGELARLVAAHPLRERLWSQRIRCLYRVGRQAEALAAYQQLRRQLGEGLGLCPSPQLAQLERDVLEQSPTLEWSPPVVSRGPAGGAGSVAPASNLPVEQEPLPFVGRTAALAQLAAWWSDVTSPCGLALVSGEPGVGKTRLATTFARLVEADGAAVLYGRAVEAGGSSYEPVLGALRRFALTADEDALDRVGETGGAALCRLVPELGERRPGLATKASAWGDVDRSWLLGAVADCFASPPPQRLLLVLDDLQWADRPGLLLLARLLEPGHHVRVLGTHRPSSGGRWPHLSDLLAGLRRDDRIVRRLTLGGLDPDDVVDLVESLSGVPASPEARSLASHLHGRTEGNAFFLREALRQLEAAGAISPAEGVWGDDRALGELSRAEGVRDVVGHRLSQLAAGTREVLRVAAVLGRDFDVDVLAAVLGTAEDEVVRAVEEAVDAGLVHEDAHHVDRCSFVHSLVHEVARSELGASRRARLEWRAGEALEALRSGARPGLAGAIARHLAAGAATGDAGKAVAWATRAATEAMSGLAYEEAVRCYDLALDALALSGAPADEERADVLLALGAAANLAGDPERRRAACLEAASVARVAGDPERLARAAISLLGTLGPGATDGAVVGLMEEGVAALRPTIGRVGCEGLLAEVLARLSGYLSNLEPDRAAALADEAVRAARHARDDRSLALALLYSTHARPLGRSEHRALLRDAEVLAERSDDPEVRLSASSQRMAGALVWADRDEFDRGLAGYTEVARATGWAIPAVLVDVDRACAVALDGRCAEALELLRDALRRSRPFGDPNRHGIRDAMVPLERELGRWQDHEAYAGKVAAMGIPLYVGAFVQVLCATGRRDEADGQLAAALASPEALSSPSVGRITLATLAEAAVAMEDTDAAATLHVILERATRYGECASLGAHTFAGSLRRSSGLVALLLGLPAEAVDHHEAALEVHERMRAPGWAARSRHDLARSLLARGRTGDRGRAAALVDAAGDTAGALGMPRLLAELAAVPV